MSWFKKKPIVMNGDLYKSDEWGYEDKMAEVNKYKAFASSDACEVGALSIVFGTIACGLMAVIDLGDFADLVCDMITYCIGGSVLFWFGGLMVISRYKRTLEENRNND